MPKPIQLNENMKIGIGAYAKVYKISPQRVVKVFTNKHHEKWLIEDEIKGSKTLALGLPVLKVVDVTIRGQQQKGLLKKFIPHKLTRTQYQKFYEEIEDRDEKDKVFFGDAHIDNFRKDSRGKIWRIDTQLIA